MYVCMYVGMYVYKYLRRVDFLEVFDNRDNTIGHFRLIEKRAPHFLREITANEISEGECRV